MAKNPYQPGVGTTPPYLAGREPQVARFRRLLAGYPEKRRNLRITGLRGVGKTVLLKEFESIARADPRQWVVIRRDFVPRMVSEIDFVTALAEYLREAAEELSAMVKVKNRVAAALKAISEIQVQVEGVTVTVGSRPEVARILEDRLRTAFIRVGELAHAADRGVALMFDEAHEVYDQPKRHEYPLSALLAAVVAAQDREDPPLPIMLVLCGLPPLVGHLHDARSHSERLFRGEKITNLSLERENDSPSEAEMALAEPTVGGPITFGDSTARRIVADVDGYPYFIQWYGEALWDAAEDASASVIDNSLYESSHRLIQRALDHEFYEGRYGDARAADQMTLRIAASLGGEQFRVADLNGAMTSRNANANAQSLKRLVDDNIIYRTKQGVYAYTAPLFGDFMRRRHPREDDDA